VSAIPDESYSPYRDVSRAQNTKLVRQLLNELPVERDRELLERLYVQDQDKEEICQALGLDSLHFNRVLHRAKQRFRQLLLHAERRSQLRVIEGGVALRPDRTA
jgi:DNA-directed RNA polymerase specialized sigma24 family protein